MEASEKLTAGITEACRLTGTGQRREARRVLAALLRQAADAYEECVVAHFMAHAEEDVGSQLAWHRRALEAAGRAEPERVTAFYPSLHANLAEAHLRRGEVEPARAQLEEARRSAHRLGSDAYGETVRALIERLYDQGGGSSR